MAQWFLNCFGVCSVNKFCNCCAVSCGLLGAAPPAPSWVSPEASPCTQPGLWGLLDADVQGQYVGSIQRFVSGVQTSCTSSG